jgi:ubiquinone/menaquinone biosynthesis C-methylase UbiE
MTVNNRHDRLIDTDDYRKNLLKFTIKAFHKLPIMEKPSILDVGCGSGLPTMELARLSNGHITGIDIDQSALDKLNSKIKRENLTDRIRTVKCSLLDMEFPVQSFDIIWAEGSIHSLPFEKFLTLCRRFIKPAGFLVMHDAVDNIASKLMLIPDYGYRVIDHFVLSGEIWWENYFRPLQARIHKIREKNANTASDLSFLDQQQREIDNFNKDRSANESAFIITKKIPLDFHGKSFI